MTTQEKELFKTYVAAVLSSDLYPGNSYDIPGLVKWSAEVAQSAVEEVTRRIHDSSVRGM